METSQTVCSKHRAVLETVEDAFAFVAKTGRHRMSINVLRELFTGDSTWSHFIPRILHEEDDHSMLKLSLSDILAVDVSNITDPNARQECVVAFSTTKLLTPTQGW